MRSVPELFELQRTTLLFIAAVVGVYASISVISTVSGGEWALRDTVAVGAALIALAAWRIPRPVLIPFSVLIGVAAVLIAAARPDAVTAPGAAFMVVGAVVAISGFVEGPMWRVAGAAMAVWAYVPFAIDNGNGWRLGVAAVGTALIVGSVTGSIRALAIDNMRRSNGLFDNAPIALMEQDWRKVDGWLRSIRESGVTDLGAHLDAHPELVTHAVGLVELIRANQATADLLRSSDRANLRGHYLAGRVNDRSWQHYRRHLVAMWDGDPTSGELFETYREDGRPATFRTHFLEHPTDDTRIVSAADLTELHDANQRLEHADRTKDRFIASVAHELRTPMSAVLGFTEEMAQRYDDFTDADRIELLDVIAREAREVSHLIDDLLVAARADLDALTIDHLPVRIVDEAKAVIRTVPGSPVPLSGDGDPTVCGDRTRIRQIIRNLLTNAARYGGPTKRVVVDIRHDRVVLEVRDDGTDISDHDLARIFKPYERAHERSGITESVGLGLTVARRLAIAMHGSLTARRDEGETVFALELPPAGACVASAEPVPADDDAAAGSPPHSHVM